MKIKTVLFDLDATLLPMNQDLFVKSYFKAIAKSLAGHGYASEPLIKMICLGMKAMVENDGSARNEEVFWRVAQETFGQDVLKDMHYFDAFYQDGFDELKSTCGYTPKAKAVIGLLKEKGYRIALATNPIFPRIATQKRMAWAGLDKDDFELITTYENSRYCKPNPKYYQEILDTLNVRADECLMVGNDVREDMVAERLGMQVFLLTDCLINRDNKDISAYRHGNFDDLTEFIQNL